MGEFDFLEEIRLWPDRPAKMDGRAKTMGKNLKKMNSGHKLSPKWLRQLKHPGKGKKK